LCAFDDKRRDKNLIEAVSIHDEDEDAKVDRKLSSCSCTQELCQVVVFRADLHKLIQSYFAIFIGVDSIKYELHLLIVVFRFLIGTPFVAKHVVQGLGKLIRVIGKNRGL